MPMAVQDPPHSLESERALLGSILLDNTLLTEIRKLLPEASAFYSGFHRIIYPAICEQIDAGRPADPVTLTERLGREGLLEQAGGAVYLSALTDAVPLSSNGATGEYCRIIREKAESRSLLNLSHSIQARIGTGQESATEILADVRQEIEVIAPATPAAEVLIKKRAAYPSIPDEAWYGMAKMYRYAMAKTSEASDNFHLASFLTIAGCLLGRSVAIGPDQDAYIYPNLFTLVVGDSGTCKEQAARRAMSFMVKCDAQIFSTNHITSAETLIDEMKEAKDKLGESEPQPTCFRTLLYLGELRELIEKTKQKGAGTVINKLCQAYDSPPILSAKARGQPTSWVKNPHLGILACSNPDWMAHLDKSDLEGGLGSRVCLVAGEPKPPDRNWQAPDAEGQQALIDRFQSIRLAYPLSQIRRFNITPAADALFDRWYLKQKTLQTDDNLIRFLGVRDILHVYKIALIYAACDMTGQIEERHGRAAIAYTDYLRDVRPGVFEGHGFSPTQVAQAAAERIIQSRARVSYAQALTLFRRQGDAMLFKRIIDALSLPGGPVEVQLSGNRRQKRFLVWRGDR